MKTSNRIAELENQMEAEMEAGFPNGELYNELTDKVSMLKMYGTETAPAVEQGDYSKFSSFHN